MAKFFGIDGPFMKYGNLVFDMIALSLIWAAMGGPVLLMVLLMSGIFANVPLIVFFLVVYACCVLWCPAACSAVYTFGKKQRGTDTYTTRDYWHAYKLNFKPCMIFSAITTAMLCLLLYNIYALLVTDMGVMGMILLPLEIVVGVECIFVMIYGTGLIARFEMKMKDYFRYAILMANKHFLTTIILTVILAASIYLTVFVNMLFIVAVPGVGFYFNAMLLERVFRNYMPDEDTELEEDQSTGIDLDAERQAIIDRYLNRTHVNDSDEDYRIVKVDAQGKEIVESEEEYRIVRVADAASSDGTAAASGGEEAEAADAIEDAPEV